MTFEATTLLLAACRWAVYIAGVALVGVGGALAVAGRATTGPMAALRALLEARLARSAITLSVAWVLALLALLAANVYSWFGAEGLTDLARYDAMLFQTRWGNSWLQTLGAGLIAVTMAVVGRIVPRLRNLSIGVITMAVVLPTPQIGHAAGHSTITVALHSVHLAGAGLWLGTVLLIVWHTWPIWRRGDVAPGALPQLLRAITPIALSGAALVVGSGLWLSLIHIWPPLTAFDTAYGTTLAVKIVLVACVVTFGWLNWRQLGPVAETGDRTRRQLRRSVVVELALGFFVVLLVTAWLSGLPTPM